MGYSISWVVTRRKSVHFFAVPIALMFSTFAFLPALADMGPKPTMEFRVKYSIPVVQAKSGQLMQSDKSDMSDAKPLPELGPQSFTCNRPRWSALAYGFKNYSQLVIQFADKTRSSNVFDKKAYNSFYQVEVRDNDLTVIYFFRQFADITNRVVGLPIPHVA